MSGPKIIIAVVGLDQHEVGSLSVARLLTDAGMEVVYLGRFNTPDSVVAATVAEDADVVGISCHSWEFLDFTTALLAGLAPLGVPLVMGGSVMTAGDAEQLRAAGVAEVFGPGSTPEQIVEGVRCCADTQATRYASSRTKGQAMTHSGAGPDRGGQR